ncbi:hypothetical protein [uncultured Roseibium sp.]|uniref:hypothetical protein n=1 Tax=uncultured Roseibium sp. TaxID=1936171 RepID=UPI0032171C10
MILVAVGYILLLFAIAQLRGPDATPWPFPGRGRPLIYALSLSVYCTSWTFYGSVGGASRNGIEFLTIYIGPVLVFGLGYTLLRRIVPHSQGRKHHLDCRFHRRPLRQKPVGGCGRDHHRRHRDHSLYRLAAESRFRCPSPPWSAPLITPAESYFPVFDDITLLIAIGMAVFTWLFGTRHIDATEHQEGLMLAIASEAIVKLIAFLAVGRMGDLHPL